MDHDDTHHAPAASSHGHGPHDGMDGCIVRMLWNWETIDACFISRSWHITSRGMFAGSCIGAVLLAMCLGLLHRLITEYDKKLIRAYYLRCAVAEHSEVARGAMYYAQNAGAGENNDNNPNPNPNPNPGAEADQNGNNSNPVVVDPASAQPEIAGDGVAPAEPQSSGRDAGPASGENGPNVGPNGGPNNGGNAQYPPGGEGGNPDFVMGVDFTGFRPTPGQQAIRAFLRVFNFAVAHFVMLLAMYYNGYIILCLCIGSWLGTYLFYWERMATDGGLIDAHNEALMFLR